MTVACWYLLSSTLIAQAENSVVQKMKFNCSKNTDVSYLLYEGTAQMISSVEGTIEIDSSKGSVENDANKFEANVRLKYRMRLERTTPIFGHEVGLAEGEMNGASALYQYPHLSRMTFLIGSAEEGNSAYVQMNFSDKEGWVASISSWFNSPESSEDLKSTNMRVSMPCSMDEAE